MAPVSPYHPAAAAAAPRLLSLVDRDRASPTYGCATRAHWHDRTQSFPNGHMQSAALALAILAEEGTGIPPYAGHPEIRASAAATLTFWASSQNRDGSFDEAYPGQRSYCATAFSTLAAADAVEMLAPVLSVDRLSPVRDAIARAARWLSRRVETLASNQACAAAAALSRSARVLGDPAWTDAARHVLAPLLDLPSTSEGWLPEYGGADTGYASVALDSLERLASDIPDPRVDALIVRMLAFVEPLLQDDGVHGGPLNRRYTGYLLPRPFEALAPRHPAAARIAARLRRWISQGRDPFSSGALDDRYLACFAANYLQAARLAARAPDTAPPAASEPSDLFLPLAGLLSLHHSGVHLIASLARGGVFRALGPSGAWTDAGAFARIEGGAWITSHQDGTRFERNPDGAECQGTFVESARDEAGPVRLSLLHAAAPILPPSPARFLQNRLRARAAAVRPAPVRFRRRLRLDGNGLSVEDEIRGEIPLEALLLSPWGSRFSFASMSFGSAADLEGLVRAPLDLTAAYRDRRAVRVTRRLAPGGRTVETSVLAV